MTVLNLRLCLLALASAAILGRGMLFAAPALSVTMTPNVTLTGAPGTYTLQYAKELGGGQLNWLTLTNISLTGTATNWLDYSGAGQAERFYRILPQTTGVGTNPNPALLVWIPPGAFTMGSPESEALRLDWGDNETQHTVTLTHGFYMSKYLLTQEDYSSVLGSNPSYFNFNENTNLPVDSVSWNDATNYCALLTQREQTAGRLPEGWVYRLPTEAEWEYACRAGTTTAFYFGNAIHGGMVNFYSYYEYDAATGQTYLPDPVGWMNKTTPVGSYPPNAWGLYSMCGNLWEWCQDVYETYPVGGATDPVGPGSGTDRVLRGGSWLNYGRICRSASRHHFPPETTAFYFGMRIVLAPAQP